MAELTEELKELINEKFLEFYFTKLGKIRNVLRDKYGVDVLLVHFDAVYGPIFAGTGKDFKISYKNAPLQAPKKLLEKIEFLPRFMNLFPEFNEQLGADARVFVEHDGLLYEFAGFKVNSYSARGGVESFMLVIISSDKQRKKIISKVVEFYKGLLSKYFDKIKNLSKGEFYPDEMKKVYDFAAENKIVQLAQTQPNDEQVAQVIEEYFIGG